MEGLILFRRMVLNVFKLIPFNSNMFLSKERTTIKFIKKEKQMTKIQDDSFRKIKHDNFIPDIVDEIDPTSDIIIAIPNKKFFLKRTITGNLNFICVNDLDLTSTTSFSKNISRKDLYDKLFISTPVGIKIQFSEPQKIPYFFKTNVFFETEKVLDENENLSSVIYYNFIISLYLDLYKLREYENVIKIPKKTPILEISFIPHYFIGRTESVKIRKTHLIESEEICENFIKTFG